MNSPAELLRTWVGLSHACVREGVHRHSGLYTVAVEGFCPFLKQWVCDQALGETEDQAWERLADKLQGNLRAMEAKSLGLVGC